jgi:hypothetical protein
MKKMEKGWRRRGRGGGVTIDNEFNVGVTHEIWPIFTQSNLPLAYATIVGEGKDEKKKLKFRMTRGRGAERREECGGGDFGMHHFFS